MRRGSALVMVILVIASVMTAVLGTQRLVLVQFNQSTSEEDNQLAYFAAKAGIEDSLLRLRYNRDYETPLNSNGAKQVQRFNLNTGAYLGLRPPTDLTPASFAVFKRTDQVYDLNMDFKAAQIGDFALTENQPSLDRDDVLTLTGFRSWLDGGVSKDYYLRYKFKFLDSCSDGLVQMQFIAQNPDKPDTIYDQLTIKQNANTNIIDSASTGNLLITKAAAGSVNTYIRLRPYHCGIAMAFATSRTVNGSGLGGDAGPKIDSLKTMITSTGYYGRAKRTLVGEYDRRSGQLIHVYDFNIYAGGDIVPKQ